MEFYNIDLVIDVGANSGSFGRQLRSLGYTGRIHSFEPLSAAYGELLCEIGDDEHWRASRVALSRSSGSTKINVSQNSYSSSLNPMLPTHLRAAPSSAYIGTEDIELKTLDSVLGEDPEADSTIWLKIDTQGSEMAVLEGAVKALETIHTIQLEMSLTPLYENEVPFSEMLAFLMDKGYDVVGLEPGFTEVTSGRLLQVDGIFHRFTDGR
jgi:FkbM family methyltransferase